MTKVTCLMCQDTHRVWIRNGSMMCKHCPMPCNGCKGYNGKNPAFCNETPCDCACNGKEITVGFEKHDQGKPRMSLVPAEAHLDVARVMTH